ncbi:DNA-methyltransferase [Melghirimyces algeriensis]|uniref:DNA-methyltransferase n=1 Tax=Melghirimyces algeriensis TaxID=910412 RepID=UPI0011575994|nr:site-specific DNA-methyltransferase [Melghirimyces algeriensis]
MRFFNVYDLLLYKAGQRKQTPDELYSFFRSKGINKAKLVSMQNHGMIPDDNHLLNAVLEYLDMSSVAELQISLGRIPDGYTKAWLDNANKIVELLKNNGQDAVNKKSRQFQPYFSTNLGTLYKGDCLELFQMIPNRSVDCLFADPPFNLDKEYDNGVKDKRTYSEYVSWCIKWLDECVRVLKPGGSLFIYNIPKWHTYLANYLNEKLNFWNWIAVDMKFSLPIRNRLYPAHYSLLYYVKGEKPKTYHAQRIPLQTCRHCGGELRDYGGYKNKMNPKGVNISDVWSDIYPVRHGNAKTRKFNELPLKLLDRIISMATNEGDTVLDPFGGSGTTFVVSELLKRKWIGFELGNCDIIEERITHPEKDKVLLAKIYEEKNILFPNKVRKLRRDNGFWLDDDFRKKDDNQDQKEKQERKAEQMNLEF